MEDIRNIEAQKEFWDRWMSEWKFGLSDSWGSVSDSKACNSEGLVLGNYKKVLEKYVLPSIDGKLVVDIGCLDGKWERQMTSAKKIICVDITDSGFKKINQENAEFYLTSGNELLGIGSDTVDFVFSMDSLVRSELNVISGYISEIKRILNKEGKACIHLPFYSQPLSRQLCFTKLNIGLIMKMCSMSGINKFSIDASTINHGVLLLINFDE